jgi:hypothetical protein
LLVPSVCNAQAEEDEGEFKSAAEMAKEEFAASLEAMATVPPVSMVEVTLDGTLEIGDHAIETVEDEIESRVSDSSLARYYMPWPATTCLGPLPHASTRCHVP